MQEENQKRAPRCEATLPRPFLVEQAKAPVIRPVGMLGNEQLTTNH